MFKRYGTLYGVVVLIFLFFLIQSSPAFYGDIATDRESFTLGVAGQNANQVTSLTAITPIKNINGWAGGYLSRQVADGEVVAETYNAHIQGGFMVRSVGVEAYAEATRDKWRMIDLALETGYFIRPGTFTWNDVRFSGGAGNYTERRDVDEGIGRDAADASTTFGWLAFVSGKYKNISGVVRYKPSLDFADTRVESSVSFNHDLSDTLALGFALQNILDSQSVADSDLHTSYLLSITFSPE